MAEGGFGISYNAIWRDGCIESWDFKKNQWKRQNTNMEVALKCLHNTQNIAAEFLKEVRYFFTIIFS